eukprot:UN28405
MTIFQVQIQHTDPAVRTRLVKLLARLLWHASELDESDGAQRVLDTLRDFKKVSKYSSIWDPFLEYFKTDDFEFQRQCIRFITFCVANFETIEEKMNQEAVIK